MRGKCRQSSKFRATGGESMGLVLGGEVRGENVLFNCEEKQLIRGLSAYAS